MKFKGTKCIEISKSEYDDVRFIYNISTCFIDAVDKVGEYLLKDCKVESSIPNYVLSDISHNLLSAVLNNYKYMKIKD